MMPEPITSMPTLAELLGWLTSTGWVEVGRNGRWATFTREHEGSPQSIDVPLVAAAAHYDNAVAQFVEDLAALEGRSPAEVFDDIRSACLDVVRVRLIGSGLESGTLGLGLSVGTLQAARDLFLAAACAAVDPRPAYLGRKPQKAMDFLKEARLARVEDGSVVLCFEVPVPPQLQQGLPVVEGSEAEFARLVTRQLMLATASLERVLPECAASSSLTAAEQSVDAGVSANLCDAVAKLIEQAGAEEARLSLSFASRRPAPLSVPRRASFRRGDLPLLREVSRGLQHAAEELDVEVHGPVVALQSKAVDAGGTVTLQIEFDGRARLVKLEVGADDYATALEAHRTFLFVRAVGTLRITSNGLQLSCNQRLRAVQARDDD